MPDVRTNKSKRCQRESSEVQIQNCVSVFSISHVVYKVLKEDEFGVGRLLSQIAKNWVDPIVLHNENGEESCCMVSSMLPCQYKAVNDPAAGPVSSGGPGRAAEGGAACGRGRKLSAPRNGQADKVFSAPHPFPHPLPPNRRILPLRQDSPPQYPCPFRWLMGSCAGVCQGSLARRGRG